MVSFILALTSFQIVFADTTGSMSNFKETRTYVENQFSDVATDAWFAENVKKAYELGLISGTSETTFNPNADITIAETITLASRLHNTYYGNTHTFNSTDVWYQTYVDYAMQNGIIKSGEYGDFNAKATRAQFAEIFASALPNEALRDINIIEDRSIPDVSMKDSYATSIYKLYRAGILTGNDDKGTFAPNTNIQRSAVAAIVSRMAIESMRVSNTLKVQKITLNDTTTSLRYEDFRYVKIEDKLYEMGFSYTSYEPNKGEITRYHPTTMTLHLTSENDLYGSLPNFALSPKITMYDNNTFIDGIIDRSSDSVSTTSNRNRISLKEVVEEMTIECNNKTFVGISAEDYLNYQLKDGSSGTWNGVRFVISGSQAYPDYIIGVDYHLNDLAEYFGINKTFYIEEVEGTRCFAVK